MHWTQQQLAQLILKRNRFTVKSKFDNQVIDSCLPWLAGISTPTAALTAAYRQLTNVESTSEYDVSQGLLLD
jgi:hypothetical protein